MHEKTVPQAVASQLKHVLNVLRLHWKLLMPSFVDTININNILVCIVSIAFTLLPLLMHDPAALTTAGVSTNLATQLKCQLLAKNAVTQLAVAYSPPSSNSGGVHRDFFHNYGSISPITPQMLVFKGPMDCGSSAQNSSFTHGENPILIVTFFYTTESCGLPD